MGDESMFGETPAVPAEAVCRCRVCLSNLWKGWKYVPAVKRLAIFGLTLREARPEALQTTCTRCGYVATHRPGTVAARTAGFPFGGF